MAGCLAIVPGFFRFIFQNTEITYIKINYFCQQKKGLVGMAEVSHFHDGQAPKSPCLSAESNPFHFDFRLSLEEVHKQ